MKQKIQFKFVRLCLAACSLAVIVEALGAGRRF